MKRNTETAKYSLYSNDMSISAVVIALNEEKNIRECLDSVRWADELVVIDSGSTDRTAEIASGCGAGVYPREFDDFMAQRNYAISRASEEWVFFIDADERATPGLGAEIRHAVSSGMAEGYFVPRRNFIFGKEMKHGGHKGDRHLRLFRKEAGTFRGIIHEKADVRGGVGELRNAIMHYSTRSVSEYMDKLDLYTRLEAEHMLDSGRKVTAPDLVLRPLAEFVKRYFILLGFLDGLKGLMFYALSSYYVMLKYLRYFELKKKRRPSCV